MNPWNKASLTSKYHCSQSHRSPIFHSKTLLFCIYIIYFLTVRLSIFQVRMKNVIPHLLDSLGLEHGASFFSPNGVPFKTFHFS